MEVALVRLAAERRSEFELADLRRCIERMESAIALPEPDLEEFSEADLAFHMGIASASRNQALSRTLMALRSLLASWIEKALIVDSTADDALAEHRTILAALEAADAGAAEVAMRNHLEDMAGRLSGESDVGAAPTGKPTKRRSTAPVRAGAAAGAPAQ